MAINERMKIVKKKKKKRKKETKERIQNSTFGDINIYKLPKGKKKNLKGD